MKINPPQMLSTEFTRNAWTVTPDPGVAPEDLLAPEAWAHVAKDLRRLDRVEAVALDGSWYAEYIVLAVGPVWAKVAMLRHVPLGSNAAPAPAPAPQEAEYAIKHRGVRKWSIIRTKDSAVMQEGIDTREQAESALAEYGVKAA